MLRRNRARLPGVRDAGAAVVGQAEALALGILEVEGGATVGLSEIARRQTALGQPVAPPGEARLAGHPEAGARDRVRPAPLARQRPVEEGHVGAGRRQPVGVEQVVGAGVVLVHRLLDEAQAERVGVEAAVARRVGGDRRHVVQAAELEIGHGCLLRAFLAGPSRYRPGRPAGKAAIGKRSRHGRATKPARPASRGPGGGAEKPSFLSGSAGGGRGGPARAPLGPPASRRGVRAQRRWSSASGPSPRMRANGAQSADSARRREQT